jgi:hypothetical protein
VWPYIEGGGKWKYYITGNFCSQIVVALNEGGGVSGWTVVQLIALLVGWLVGLGWFSLVWVGLVWFGWVVTC